MKTQYWLLPVLMMIGTWLHALICELLARDSEYFRWAMALLLFVLIGFILNRTCTRKTVLVSAAGLLIFSLVVTVLNHLPVWSFELGQLGMGMAFLWEAIFFPFLSLPVPDIPVLYVLFPALIPFVWALFCKQTS